MAKTGIADIIMIHEGRVLLVQQRRANVYGKWGFPGGHIEKNESAEEAVVRELQEELGITISTIGLKRVNHEEDGGSEGMLLVSTFVSSTDVFVPRLQLEELMGFGWFKFSDLKGMVGTLRAVWMPELIEKVAGLLIA
jgi:8-oxo-dGTP pyrophosphatase MutT (NUDIX family)